jgi:23S rRNA (cytosine1962-C5)-methyltransferase
VSDYELLDSGEQAKLERFGALVLRRPSPQAYWRPLRDRADWDRAHASYERSAGGGGEWACSGNVPEAWPCRIGAVELELRRTGFGHVGVFTEQIPYWRWLTERCAARSSDAAPPRVLNLFAYTGGGSIAAAMGGAEVTHCDASRGVVQWASENAARNDLGSGTIRWIVDDALKFLHRESRRGNSYHGIVLDPPSFGRGPKGEVFKLEDSVADLLEAVAAVLDPDPAFVLLSAHTPGLGPLALRNLLAASLGSHSAASEFELDHGEMSVAPSGDGFELPSGTWARASRQ